MLYEERDLHVNSLVVLENLVYEEHKNVNFIEYDATFSKALSCMH